MKHLIALLGIAGSLAAVAATAQADEKKYTMADLKSLVAAKSFKEAVQHLGDISPSERNADWLDVAATAGAGYIGGLSNDDLVVKVIAIEKLDGDFPQIIKSPKYTKVRGEIGLKAYEACFQNSYWIDECLQHALKFIDADTGNYDLALKMSKLVRRNANAYGAIPFFKKALGGKNDAAVCKDDDMKLAVVAALGLPPDYDNQKAAREIAGGACWGALQKPIVEAWGAEESGYLHDNGCELLKAKKAVPAGKTCK